MSTQREQRQLLGGRYRLRSLIARGGMSEVWDAWDVRLDRAVAVKLLRSDLAGTAELASRLDDEAKAVARLSHPNVVAVYDAGTESGPGAAPWVVMERLPGTTLADLVRQKGSLPLAEVQKLAREVLAALAAAHQAGLVHRDIKPANILIASDGSAKVGDFGIARLTKATTKASLDATSSGLVMGTPGYLAPEIVEGQQATVRSDIWSVGVVLFEALTGRRPFAGDSAVAVAQAARLARDRGAGLAQACPRISAATASTIEKALAYDPALRWESATAMARALAAAQAPKASVQAPTAPTAQAAPTARMAPTRQLRTTTMAAAEPIMEPTSALPPRRLSWLRISLIAALLGLAAAFGLLEALGDGGPKASEPPAGPTASHSFTAAAGSLAHLTARS